MKYLVILLSLFMLSSFNTVEPPIKVIFFGDSITQAGANDGGYIRIAEANAPQGKYEMIGKGIGGNKVYDLYLRLEKDVLELNPDVVVVYVGINDVWHKKTSGTGTDEDKFLGFYKAIISKLKAQGIRVIICTPSVIGEKTDFSNALDGDLVQYSKNIRNLATEENVELLDLRKEFLAYENSNNNQNLYKGILTSDGVHLNETGNSFLANLMLEKLEEK